MMRKVRVVLFLIGSLWQVMSWVDGCPAIVNKEVEPLKFCESTLVDNQTHLQVQCYLHSVGDTLLHPFTSSTGISVIATLKTALKVDLTPNHLQPSSCLRVQNLQVKKINPIENERYIKSSDSFYMSPTTMLLFITIERLELKVRLMSDKAIGLVRFNSSCIGELIRSQQPLDNGHFNVSRCVFEVRVLRAHLGDDGLIERMLKASALDSSQTVTATIDLIFNFWFDMHNGIVESLSLTFVDVFPEFPKQVVPMLSKRQIEALHFPNNVFQTIKNDNFPDLPTLKVLDFRECHLTNIEPLAFQSMTNLVHLNLAGNRLKQIPQALTPLINLEILNISSNQLSDGRFRYSTNILGRLSKLKILDLSHTPLASSKDIENYHDSPIKPILNSLQVLNLTNASLSDFPELFNGMFPNLEILVLSDNHIKSEESLITNTWNRLLTLQLNGNKLTSEVSCSSLFAQFPKLRLLNLARNDIDRFSPLDMSNVVSHPRLLNLSGNSIRLWNKPMLSMATKTALISMDMTRNNITEMTAAMLTDFSKLNHIYLNENPFDCKSCELGSFQEWLKVHQNSTDHGVSPYKCVFPKQSVGRLVADVIFDPDLCLFNWLVNVIIPILVIIVTVSAVSFLVFHYRWHLRYLWHIWQAKWTARRNGYIDLDSPPEYRYEAFVSYSGSDSGWVVEHLIPMIEEEEPKLHLCVHERDFLIGEAVINNVIKCIDISRKSIFLISNSFIQSQWCQWELQMAQHKLFEDKKDVLVLIVLEELVKSDIPRELQRLMATRTYHVWPGTHNAAACRVFWARLRQCIGPCHCLQKQLEDRGIFFR